MKSGPIWRSSFSRRIVKDLELIALASCEVAVEVIHWHTPHGDVGKAEVKMILRRDKVLDDFEMLIYHAPAHIDHARTRVDDPWLESVTLIVHVAAIVVDIAAVVVD